MGGHPVMAKKVQPLSVEDLDGVEFVAKGGALAKLAVLRAILDEGRTAGVEGGGDGGIEGPAVVVVAIVIVIVVAV